MKTIRDSRDLRQSVGARLISGTKIPVWVLLFGIATLLPCTSLSALQAETKKAILFPSHFDNLAPVPAAKVSEGWIALFDGHSLFGWRTQNEQAWQVQDSVLHGAAIGAMLRSGSQFDNFELEIEYKCTNDGVASLFLRTSPKPKNRLTDCLEVCLASRSSELPVGSILSRKKAEPSMVDNGQNKVMRIMCNRGKVEVQLNGNVVAQCENAKPLGRGFIGLLSKSGFLSVKRLWLRPIAADSLFNQRDLSNWTASQGNDFTAKAGIEDRRAAIKLQGGPGFLESSKSYRDFFLQLQSKISAKGNSGVFFRCVPGENTNGYESQIDHSSKDGVDAMPSNCGTGGVFRRKDARRLVSEDQSWFAKTIVVEGPHVAVWVNGYQVTDWNDRRKPDRNPRRGLRKSAGTLMLQGHDAETTVWFRKIRIREMETREK